MILSQVGVALARIGIAFFEVGAAQATPKVYKYPSLIVVEEERCVEVSKIVAAEH